jgi:hypothetical protein
MNAATQPNGTGQHDEQTDDHGELLDKIIERTSQKLDAREAAFMETQLDTAYKRPRSIKNFIQRATEMATLDEQTAASCTYSVPRGGKKIQGPSVRLVEICALAWGNLHVDSRVVEIGDKFVKAGATCWDMQTNNRMGQEIARNITNKSGGRFTDDMIIVTLNAAMSIALRNAILRVIPRSYVEMIRMKAVEVVRGDVRTLTKRRDDCVKHWGTQGIDLPRLLAALGRASIDEIDLDDIVTLRGFDTAIKSGEAKIDECFPPLTKPVNSLPTGREKLAKPEPDKAPELPADKAPEPLAEPAGKQPEDNAALEREDALLRIREGLKEKTLTEKTACGWIKPPLAKLDNATAEQLQAIEAELAKRT